MTPRERRLREQAQRHRLIVATAREMAEAEGWDNVTTRRLADRIEYSQPVLYQHFKNKDAIVHAVAQEGLAELAGTLRAARLGAGDAPEALRAVARAYADFAARGPVLYQTMLVLDPGAEADAEADESGPAGEPGPAPHPLAAVLDEIEEAVRPLAAGRDSRLLAEVVWSAWHGLAGLTHGGRLAPQTTPERLAVLAEVLTDPAAQLT
ncbi:TetR/AcrR family transcriptional regulator [Streptomyces brasiliensis]|uniref:TetR family transcriptional regulator n=1 Tax=Streptomyces brasiliensis TaxID=1954 RepID=A0A917L9F7_9ACTN|nr:TetR family transcriptional regulator [Streptomyces brasiliensis]GGJ51521.1 TetR family transcriptional regulator [Streptomyces brasiliensis]